MHTGRTKLNQPEWREAGLSRQKNGTINDPHTVILCMATDIWKICKNVGVNRNLCEGFQNL